MKREGLKTDEELPKPPSQMPIDSNESLVPDEPTPVQAKLVPQKVKPKDPPLLTIKETQGSLKRAGMDTSAAARWKAITKVGRFIGQQGPDEYALAFLTQNVEKMSRLIKQCEEILAKPHSEHEGAGAQRTLINASAEMTKACEQIARYKKFHPVDPTPTAPKSAGPPPRSAVTAQQVNVFVGKKDAP